VFSFTLLGTGVTRPLPNRALTSSFVKIDGDRYLLDVPEGVQTRMSQDGTGFNLDGILLTSLGPENLLGLPGLISTLHHLSNESAVDPSKLIIYVPEQDGAVNRIQKFDSLVGGTATLNVQPIKPGESVIKAENYTIDSLKTRVSTGGVSMGYRFTEHDRKGVFDRSKAESLGVPVGPLFSQLHDGESVELADGRVIQSEQVVGKPRPGRSLVYTGATEHVPGLADAIRGVDVFICDGGITSDDYVASFTDNHMSAYQAGTLAEAAEASVLIPTHIRGRYGPKAHPLKGDLRESFSGYYFVPHDGYKKSIKARDTTARATHQSEILGNVP
jgi:ribonuclease Z